MRVRLSNPWQGHAPGDVIDVDEQTVRQLDRGGYLARGKDGKPIVVAQRAKKTAKESAEE